MAFPSTCQEYYFPKIEHYKHLTVKERKVNPPGPHEVLVKIHAVSLNFRDLMIASGNYSASTANQLVPCSDMSGEIMAVGDKVKGWKVGDRVCANFSTDHLHGDPTLETQSAALGGHSHGVLTEYRTFPSHALVAIPDHLSYEEASTLPCAAVTAYNALMGPVPLKAGDTVLVLGTGGVAIFSLQLAVASGAEVIVLSSSDDKLKIATKLGAKHVINYKKTPNWDQEVSKLTDGRGVDHVIEIGGSGTLLKSMTSARIAGWVHIIGFLASDKPPDVILAAIRRATYIRGIQIGSVTQFEAMNRLIAAHPQTTRPVIDKVFEFKDAVAAYAHLESQAHVGKVVIKVA